MRRWMVLFVMALASSALDEGYWRPGGDHRYKCLWREACDEDTCGPRSSGARCGECRRGSYPNPQQRCQNCDEASTAGAVMGYLAVGAIAVAFVVFFQKVPLLLVSPFQIIASFQTLDVAYPQVFAHVQLLGHLCSLDVLHLVPATRCFLHESPAKYYTATLVAKTLAPLLFFRRPVLAVHVLVPAAALSAARALQCSEYDDVSFLDAAPTIECESRLYRRFLRVYGSLALALYLSIPLVYLVRRRKQEDAVDLGKRLVLTSGLVFLTPQRRFLVGFVVAIVFALVAKELQQKVLAYVGNLAVAAVFFISYAAAPSGAVANLNKNADAPLVLAALAPVVFALYQRQRRKHSALEYLTTKIRMPTKMRCRRDFVDPTTTTIDYKYDDDDDEGLDDDDDDTTDGGCCEIKDEEVKDLEDGGGGEFNDLCSPKTPRSIGSDITPTVVEFVDDDEIILQSHDLDRYFDRDEDLRKTFADLLE